MNLKEAFYRKVVDPVLCPPRVVFKDGSDPLAKGTASKLMSRSDFLLPLLGSASFIAIDSAVFGGNNTGAGMSFLFGHLISTSLSFLTERNSPDSRAIEPIKQNNVKYYIDRTKPQDCPIDISVLLDLNFRKINANIEFVIAPIAITTTAAGLSLLFNNSITDPAMWGVFSNFMILPIAKKWQAKRGIEGAWSIDKEPPKKPEKKKIKTHVPAPAM